MTDPGESIHRLAEALRAVRAAVAEVDFPLPLPTAAPARERADALLGQIDDYLLPRLTNLDAPLLVVVGGSTGAGKSTLVNSLVQAPVSAAGVLRPTTRAPVLVCHPADTPWFRSDRLLATLPRARTGGPAGEQQPELQLIDAPALSPGVALVDAPDIDSVVDTNRALARKLFNAADLWLFVVSAARYADAVPWRMLHAARARGTVIALVLSRVPPPATVELVGLFSEMLTEHGLGNVPLFVLPETRLGRQGLLPESATEPLRTWLDGLAGDARARSSVIRYTLDGALAAVPDQLGELADAAEEQLTAAETLAEQVGLAYGLARGTVERGVRANAVRSAQQGSFRPAPVEEFSRALRTSIGNWRDRLNQATGRAVGTRHRQTPAESGLVTLVRSAATDAAEQTGSAWRANPAGAALLRQSPGGSPTELVWQVQRIIREQSGEGLTDKIGQLLDAEAARWLERLVGVPIDGGAQRLRTTAAELEQARLAARLTAATAAASVPEPRTPPGNPQPTATSPVTSATATAAEPSPPATPAQPAPASEPPPAAAAPAEPAPAARTAAEPVKESG